MSTIKSMAMALVMAVAANAEIVDNYYWQKYDKIFDKNIEIKDGIPYGTDEATDHFVQSSRASCGHKDDYLTQANVLRVRRVFPIAKFNEFTNEANRDCQYSYDNFLRAVAKYPAFCNESAHGDSVVQLDEMCKKELATLFAHMSRTSDNFTLTEEAGCSQYS